MTNIDQPTMAEDPQTSPEVLARLAGGLDRLTRFEVAYNPSTPVEVLARLAGDPEPMVRCAVAFQPRTPPEVWNALASDADPRVRRNAAANPDALLLRASVPPEIRVEGAEWEATPSEILAQRAFAWSVLGATYRDTPSTSPEAQEMTQPAPGDQPQM